MSILSLNIHRLSVALATSAALTFAAGSVYAQGDVDSEVPMTAPENATPAAPAEGEADIQAQLKALQENLQKIGDALNNGLMVHDAAIQQNMKDISDLKAEVKDLSGQLSDVLAKQEQILSAMAAGGNGNLPRLSAMMDTDENVRKEWTDVVHKAMQNKGTVIIRNKTEFPRTISVNQMEFTIPAMKDKTITDVPVGNFVTNLEGEGTRTWSLAPPYYEQAIDIVPKETVAARPVSDGSTGTTTIVREVEVPAYRYYNYSPYYYIYP